MERLPLSLLPRLSSVALSPAGIPQVDTGLCPLLTVWTGPAKASKTIPNHFCGPGGPTPVLADFEMGSLAVGLSLYHYKRSAPPPPTGSQALGSLISRSHAQDLFPRDL